MGKLECPICELLEPYRGILTVDSLSPMIIQALVEDPDFPLVEPRPKIKACKEHAPDLAAALLRCEDK